ncbi:MAG: hypothetical protein M1832_003842 [Thelocarpon impressellum]|nr:MAG: hypothetical protein M1832_003842 [Thelocarpon impressellum]
MAAQGLDIFALVIPNPEWPGTSEIDRVPMNISFSLHSGADIRTLSTNTANRGDSISGLLYVPDIAQSDPCFNASKSHVPANVTRQANLPKMDYDLVALAPWISPKCTLTFLEAARLDPVGAFVFYQPDLGADQPPPISDAMWGLGDGGRWKSENHYPVYAVPGQTGAILMQELGRYSGNMTDVENGHQLTELFDARDYVRLYAELDLGSRSALPSIWVFLIIVLAVIIAIVGFTSTAMHWIQRRNRLALRRRVASGEVDLEALGIKRVLVSRELLDEMPLFVYVAEAETDRQDDAPTTAHQEAGDADQQKKPVEPEEDAPANPGHKSFPAEPTGFPAPCGVVVPTYVPPVDSLPRRILPYSQATCPICLEDFSSGRTIVRELPCKHIYHPECVDDFFLTSSSLCPLCKKSVLPSGHCPKEITNAMVRRERMIRRMRESVVEEQDEAVGAERRRREALPPPARPAWDAYRRLVRAWISRRNGRAEGDVEMFVTPPRVPSSADPEDQTAPAGQVPAQPSARAEWARRRANAMLGRSVTAEAAADGVAREGPSNEGVPRWRKAVKMVFPGFN